MCRLLAEIGLGDEHERDHNSRYDCRDRSRHNRISLAPSPRPLSWFERACGDRLPVKVLLQIVRKFRCCFVTAGRVSLQTFHTDCGEVQVNTWLHTGWWDDGIIRKQPWPGIQRGSAELFM